MVPGVFVPSGLQQCPCALDCSINNRVMLARMWRFLPCVWVGVMQPKHLTDHAPGALKSNNVKITGGSCCCFVNISIILKCFG